MSENYPTIEFSSLDELCMLVTIKTKDWDSCWYRGCTSPQHSLLPSLFRDEQIKRREGYLAVEFRRRAHSRIKGISSQFDWLCAMQRYGLPTRLLDWSESLAVALYFSIGDRDWHAARPTIWLLDPFALASLTDEESNIPIPSDERVSANADVAFADDWDVSKQYVSHLPLPVAPNFLFDRLSAQNGTFTIHGSDARSLDELLMEAKQELLLKLVAKSECVTDIVNSIRLLRPSSDAIFPDIDGMKAYLV